MRLEDERAHACFLVRDRDSKLTASLDEVFRGQGTRLIEAPVRAPRARAHADGSGTCGGSVSTGC